MSSLRLWTIGPVAEFLHETTKGSKKVGIAVRKHQVWWKSRDGWWMLPKRLVASTTKFCSKKKRDFGFASCSVKIVVEFALPSAKIIQKHQVASMGFIRCLLFFLQEAVWDRAAHPRLPEKHSGTQGWDGTRGRKMQSLQFLTENVASFPFPYQPSRTIVRQSTSRRGIAILQPSRCWWTATEKDRTDETQKWWKRPVHGSYVVRDNPGIRNLSLFGLVLSGCLGDRAQNRGIEIQQVGCRITLKRCPFAIAESL